MKISKLLMLAILLLATAFSVCAQQQRTFGYAIEHPEEPLKLTITVDKASWQISDKGTKYALVSFHWPETPTQSMQIMCVYKNADCFLLTVGGHFEMEFMKDNDPDGYVGYDSLRITGDDKSAVYLDPASKKDKKKTNGTVVSSN